MKKSYFSLIIAVAMFGFGGLIAQPTVTSVNPVKNADFVGVDAKVFITFSEAMDEGTLTTENIVVRGSVSGVYEGTITYYSEFTTVEFTPSLNFKVGEVITVTVKASVKNLMDQQMAELFVYQFYTVNRADKILMESDKVSPGNKPQSADFGDFNEDGFIDMLFANSEVDSVTFILNDGEGNFSTMTQFYMGAGALPTSAAVGDFNNDGLHDFVVTNYNYANMEVFINQGGLSFNRTTYATQNGPVSAATADFDGDGNLDIVVYNRSSGTYTWFSNDGYGNFGVGTSSGVYEYNGNRVRTVDIDGDGDIDFVTSGQGHNVNIIKNNNDGSFSTPINTGIGNIDDVKFADLDGDGDLDMVTVNRNASKLRISWNNGSGSFPSYDEKDLNNTSSIAFLDLDGDLDLDIVVTTTDEYLYDQIEYLMNNGSGEFNRQYGFYMLEEFGYSLGKYPYLNTLDVNGDGLLDLIQTSRIGSYTVINLGREKVYATSISPAPNSLNVSTSANFSATFNYPLEESTITTSSVVAWSSFSGKLSGEITYNEGSKTITFDPDEDLKPGDVVQFILTKGLENTNGTQMEFGTSSEFTIASAGSGKGHFEAGALIVFPSDQYPSRMKTGDLNGDGYADIVTANYSAISIVLSNGDGTYGEVVSHNVSNYPTDVTIGDFDNDGDLDIGVLRYTQSRYLLFVNDGDGLFTQHPSDFDSYFHYQQTMMTKDINNDGLQDILVSNGSSQSSNFYIQNGTWSFTHRNFSNNWAGQYSVLVDLENDGDLDLIQNDSYENRISLIKNLGGATDFSEPETYAAGYKPMFLVAADIDGDGFPDVIVVNEDGGYSILKNNGNGGFESPVFYSSYYPIVKIGVSDLNGDGDLDLVLMPDESDNYDYLTWVTVAFNNGSGIFNSDATFAIRDWGGFFDLSVVDADNDGDMDLMILYSGYSEELFDYKGISVYINTTASEPTTATTNLSSSLNQGSRMTINWDKGNGTKRIVVVKEGAEVDVEAPNDYGNYSANSVFQQGHHLGSGNYIVYNGGGKSVQVTGLSLSTTYHYKVFELNGSEGDEVFYKGVSPSGSFITNSKDGYDFATTPGTALSFNGTDAKAEYLYESDMPKNITFSMWVKVTDSSSIGSFFVRGEEQYIGDQGDLKLGDSGELKNEPRSNKMMKLSSNVESDDYYPIKIGIDSGFFFASVYDDDEGDPVNITGTDTVNNNQWYHIALSMSYDENSENSTIYFFVNGKEIGNTSLYYEDSGESFILGYDYYNYFAGQFDELRIYDKALTPTEIRSTMHKTLSGFPNNLWGYWQFNEGSGTIASQQVSSAKFYLNESVTWVTSSVPIGEGTTASTTAFQSGTQTIGNATLDMADGFDNPVDIYVTEITGEPNEFPDGYISSLGGKVFVIELFGDPGTFSASLTLNFGSNVLDETVNSNPSQLKLYKRPSTSIGEWADLGGATSADYVTGDVTWTGITSFSQFMAVSEFDAVPVELSSFSAYLSGNQVKISWSTASETNNAGFEVQRKTNSDWLSLGFVAGNGTTTETKDYAFVSSVVDLNVPVARFRLKQVDMDGKSSYSSILTIELMPTTFALDQNYPNPFNPTTMIKFQTPISGDVKITVFDVLGREVAILTEGFRESGNHTLEFNAKGLSTGIYFVKMESGHFTSTKKMMLLK